MAQSRQNQGTNEQWYMTAQGATIYGLEPEGGECQSWRFTILLRDLVFGLPAGVNHQEWREWVEEIDAFWMVSTNDYLIALLSNLLAEGHEGNRG